MYDLPFKSYSRCKSFCGQTNGQVKKLYARDLCVPKKRCY